MYDDDAVSEELARLTNGRIHDIIAPTPPTAGLVLWPLAFLPDRWLTAAWTAGNPIALASSIVLLLIALEWPAWTWSAVTAGAALFCLSSPLQENLARGQLYLWMLWSFSLVAYGYATGRDGLTSVGLALAMLLKVAWFPIWLFLAASRRWVALAGALLISASTILIGLPWIGFESYRRWAGAVVPAWLVTPKMMVPAYQTISGLLNHLFRFDAQWNPAPLVDAPRLAVALTVVIVTLLLWCLMTRRPSLVTLAAAVQIGIICQPVAEQYHYVYALIPVAVGARESLRRRHLIAATAIAVAAALMFAPLPFKDPALWASRWAFLAYPRLFGALLLVITLLTLADSRRDARMKGIP